VSQQQAEGITEEAGGFTAHHVPRQQQRSRHHRNSSARQVGACKARVAAPATRRSSPPVGLAVVDVVPAQAIEQSGPLPATSI